MQVKDVLAGKGRDIYTINADATVYDAISKMSAHNVGSLLILDGPRLTGIISDRDYRDKVILMGRTSRQTLVNEIMTTNVVTVAPKDPVHECMEIMTRKKIRHLPVLENNRVTGVISIGDIVKSIIDRQEAEINDLKKYIRGSYPS